MIQQLGINSSSAKDTINIGPLAMQLGSKPFNIMRFWLVVKYLFNLLTNMDHL